MLIMFQRSDYTFGATLPASLIIGRQPDGTVYVDNDKIWDIDNILSDFVSLFSFLPKSDVLNEGFRV